VFYLTYGEVAYRIYGLLRSTRCTFNNENLGIHITRVAIIMMICQIEKELGVFKIDVDGKAIGIDVCSSKELETVVGKIIGTLKQIFGNVFDL